MGGWGCPHEVNGQCRRVPGRECDPGMKGCTLHGKVGFSKEEKNSPRMRRQLAQRDARGRRKPAE